MKRIVLLSGLVYVLLLGGLAGLHRGLLALAIPLLVYLAVALISGPVDLRLRAVRSVHPDRVVAGTPVTMRLSIGNEGSTLERFWAQDLLPSGLAVDDGKAFAAAVLAPGETLDMEYTVRTQRGCYDLPAVRVSTGDLLGLSQRTVRLVPQSEGAGQLLVLPRVVRLHRLAIRPRRTRGHAGPVPARLGGSGTDFFGVREYQPGDARRWINWRASARHDTGLFTNQFEQERIADVGLILDARARSDVQFGNDSLFEHAIGATASLADAFLRDGNRVGLLMFGRYVDWTFPGTGKVQRERILRALARARPGESEVFGDLGILPTRLFPAGSQIVLVSPVTRDDLPVLLRLRARGYQLLVIRPNAVDLEMQGLPHNQAVELAARILRAEWKMVRRRLQQAGVQVVDWPVDRLLDQVVHTTLGRVPPWFRALGM
jgi:uncharacterized protein (DUF58 family)